MRPSLSKKKTLFASKPQYFAACFASVSTCSLSCTVKFASRDPAPSPPMCKFEPVVSSPGRKCTSTDVVIWDSSCSLGLRVKKRSMVSFVALEMPIFFSVSSVTVCCDRNAFNFCCCSTHCSLHALSSACSAARSCSPCVSCLLTFVSSLLISLWISRSCEPRMMRSSGLPSFTHPSTKSLAPAPSPLAMALGGFCPKRTYLLAT
mmetsp:Transcript_79697/g.221786  ORF Transcript_79697/g.221786 Transcript_79697/m.221786 type:complete len:205 (+) Transcript_79697:2361-2975(+)